MFDLACTLRDRCRRLERSFSSMTASTSPSRPTPMGFTSASTICRWRRLGAWLADGMVVGFSPLAMADVVAAKSGGADYVGLGPVFGTASKADAQPELGLFALAEQAAAAELPSVGIGGIDVDNAGAVIRPASTAWR